MQTPHQDAAFGAAHCQTFAHLDRRLGGQVLAGIERLCGFSHIYCSSLRIMSCRASANQPGPAEELKIILPFTTASASLKQSPASGWNDDSSLRYPQG